MAFYCLISALLFLLYTYALYPLAMRQLALFMEDPPGGADVFEPEVAIVIVARNEQSRIRAKVESCLDQEYPKAKLRVIVALDGPNPETLAVLQLIDNPNVRIVGSEIHRGKSATLNDAIKTCREPVLVMTDARQRLDRQAVRYLVNSLADPTVGAVSGELMFELSESDEVGKAIDAYWRYEKSIRRSESIVHSSIGVTGALYAIRRECFEPLPSNTILDDVMVPMKAVLNGWRVRFESRAIAYDHPSHSMSQERARKIRTLAGNFQLLQLCPELLNPARNPVFLQFVSHKVFRLIAPVVLVVAFAANVALAFGSWLFAALLALQVTLYLMAMLAGVHPALTRNRLARLAATFVSMHAFVVLGFVEYLANKDAHLWVGPSVSAGHEKPTGRD